MWLAVTLIVLTFSRERTRRRGDIGEASREARFLSPAERTAHPQTGSVRFRGRLIMYSSRRLISVRREMPRSSAAFALVPVGALEGVFDQLSLRVGIDPEQAPRRRQGRGHVMRPVIGSADIARGDSGPTETASGIGGSSITWFKRTWSLVQRRARDRSRSSASRMFPGHE